MKHRYGFTLIELLIVVAIIAILAAIAVPNFLESQTRAKVTRAMNDLRAVTVALEAYRVDNNKYPPCEGTFDGTVGLSYVTSPVAYIVGTNVRDVYARETATGANEAYAYSSRDFEEWAEIGSGRSAHWYIISSNGPNLIRDDFRVPVETDNFEAFMNVFYDPTNGTVSTGNVYRSGGVFEGPGEGIAHHVVNYGIVK